MWTFENSADNWWGLDEKLLAERPEYVPNFEPLRDWLSPLHLNGNIEEYIKKLAAAGFRNPDHLLLLEPTERDFISAGITDRQDLEKIQEKIRRETLLALLKTSQDDTNQNVPQPYENLINTEYPYDHQENQYQAEPDQYHYDEQQDEDEGQVFVRPPDYGRHYQDEAAYYTNKDLGLEEQEEEPFQENEDGEYISDSEIADWQYSEASRGDLNSLPNDDSGLSELMAECGIVDEFGTISFEQDALLSLLTNPGPEQDSEPFDIDNVGELTVDFELLPMPSIPSLPAIPVLPNIPSQTGGLPPSVFPLPVVSSSTPNTPASPITPTNLISTPPLSSSPNPMSSTSPNSMDSTPPTVVQRPRLHTRSKTSGHSPGSFNL